ncbi:hypothetical protein EKI60_02295 [Candidatus Saccharibacteria bacterium]|nr:MAG: hypothetical protein EKI60_02295 [Candidatus Saccharibacteria bacterium]
MKKRAELTWFRNADGQLTLFQRPNILIFAWLACTVLSRLSSAGTFKTGMARLATTLLFTWAFLELTQGVNYFRRCLGAGFMLIIIINFFR